MGLWQRTTRLLNLRNVHCLGRRNDMPELYRAVDAMLLPTLGENQSLATLEAMASGLPVVTTPIPAQKEVIRHGKAGLLIPPRPSALAYALQNLPKQLGEEARTYVLAHHTLEASAKQLSKTLEEI